MREAQTRLIGRDEDVARLLTLLKPGGPKLITLIGPGGVGKTSLAREVAALLHEEGAPVRFIELEDDRDLRRLAGVLRSDFPARPDGLVLVLDNVEQLLPDLARLLSASGLLGSARLLLTSRVVLRLAAEHVVMVAPLALPASDDAETVSASPAARMFLSALHRRHAHYAERLRSSPDGLAEVARLCRRLEGLPLALEIAASGLRAQTVESLLSRMDAGVPLEGRLDFAERHRSLERNVRWSYDLLPEGRHVWLRHLGTFEGAWTLPLAEAYARQVGLVGDAVEIVTDLVDASVLDVEFTGGVTRYRLPNAVRELACEELRRLGELDFAREAARRVSEDETSTGPN